jgi:DNA-3-methyladenine glycosylase I
MHAISRRGEAFVAAAAIPDRLSEGATAMAPDQLARCAWVPVNDPLYVAYHDEEWGVPVHDDRRLFEFLILEGAQAGLSWATILRKRENYRAACDGFDPRRAAAYGDADLARLLEDRGLVRNRLKLQAMVGNARAYLDLAGEFGSAATGLWQFVGGAPRRNVWRSVSEVPAQTGESEAMSKFLRQRGFRFVGPTICYAFMQAVGMVNDHTVDCFRYDEV